MNERPVALITGATGGLGQVLAPYLLDAGYDVALFGSSQERLASMSEELAIEDDRHVTVAVDLREADATNAAIEQVYERFGRVDALAHLVGGWTGGERIAEAGDEPFAQMLDQHLWTTLNVTRVLSPRMAAAGFGRIVGVSSPMAVDPSAGMAAYAVGKAAEEALLDALAKEVIGDGVTVNVVRVRAIDPTGAGGPDEGAIYKTTAAEISAAILYLFSDSARSLHGQHIGLHSGI